MVGASSSIRWKIFSIFWSVSIWCCSNLSIRWNIAALADKKRRMATKARMIAMFALIAISLLKRPASIEMPCSVKAWGNALLSPPQLEVPFRHFKFSTSSLVNWNIKSSGKRSMLRLTCLFNWDVSTWYRRAKSRSSITCSPLMIWMQFCIPSPVNIGNDNFRSQFATSVMLDIFFFVISIRSVGLNFSFFLN